MQILNLVYRGNFRCMIFWDACAQPANNYLKCFGDYSETVKTLSLVWTDKWTSYDICIYKCVCVCRLWTKESVYVVYHWGNLNEKYPFASQQTLLLLKREHFEQTTSTPCLLMPWLLASPSHQHLWDWQCKIIESFTTKFCHLVPSQCW